jgi:Leucine-rich repeat (LRR) protein
VRKNKPNSLFNSFHKGSRIFGFAIIFFFFLAGSLNAQNQNPEVLRQKMAKIRQSTDWNDPVAAKKANDEIKNLSKELMLSGKNQTPVNHYDSIKSELEKEDVDYKMKVWGQMQESAKKGEDADVLLADPIREEIKQKYKEEDDKTVKNNEFLEKMPLLIINMSMSGVQAVIDQMQAYTGVRILIITCEKKGTPVILSAILAKASHYPLEELYIINFGSSVTTIPSIISTFSGLKLLGLYNNNLYQLPPSISQLADLEELYVESNPISSLVQVVIRLKKLKELGIAKTSVSNTELEQIQQDLPNCKILKQ